MKATAGPLFPPATLMVWTLNDEVVEHPDILEFQFHELRAAGFPGVAPYVRCSRYTWNDPAARAAFHMIGRLCRAHEMKCWIGPDPRFVSRTLIAANGGFDVLFFGNRARADVFPNLGAIDNGRFSVRCDISPRHVHTLNEVAVEYTPRGVERLYAVRLREGSDTPEEVRDISSAARFFYNAREHYVEAFGTAPRLDGGEWKVLAFFRATTNHVDYSDPQQMKLYHAMLARFHKSHCAVDGIMWDEPGFTCTYGTVPYPPMIRQAYARSAGKEVRGELWKLALPAKDESHVRVRTRYYRAIQQAVNTANTATTKLARRLWGRDVVSGVHDTWHFESADMCDMNHGSLDLWEAMKAKTGGFVDIGGIDQLRNPDSPWYTNLATMSVACASLGKMSSGGYAYNNLWTVGDDGGEGWQTTVLDHCVNIMALFGTGWMAHAYGPVGTIGEERSFLGSPPLPGYPGHSTWPGFPAWNRRLTEHLQAVEHRLPEARLLVVFPVETLYALAGPRADEAARSIFALLLVLLDNHHQVDLHAASVCRKGSWSNGSFVLGDSRYGAVLLPNPDILHPDLRGVIREGGEKVLFLGGVPQRTSAGRKVFFPSVSRVADIPGALRWLAAKSDPNTVRAPSQSWATVSHLSTGTMVSLAPSRHGYRYRGEVSIGESTVNLPECHGLVRVLFPQAGPPELTFPPQ